MKKTVWLRNALILPIVAILSGCQLFGMAGAVRITGESFDRAECLARDFKGEAPCPGTDRNDGQSRQEPSSQRK